MKNIIDPVHDLLNKLEGLLGYLRKDKCNEAGLIEHCIERIHLQNGLSEDIRDSIASCCHIRCLGDVHVESFPGDAYAWWNYLGTVADAARRCPIVAELKRIEVFFSIDERDLSKFLDFVGDDPRGVVFADQEYNVVDKSELFQKFFLGYICQMKGGGNPSFSYRLAESDFYRVYVKLRRKDLSVRRIDLDCMSIKMKYYDNNGTLCSEDEGLLKWYNELVAWLKEYLVVYSKKICGKPLEIYVSKPILDLLNHGCYLHGPWCD